MTTTENTRTRGGSDATRSSGAESLPRLINLALGAWLFVSAFLLPRAGVAFTSTWIMGVVIVGFALLEMAAPLARWMNTLAGAWVFIAAFVIPHASVESFWNDLIVGAAVALLSLVPTKQEGQAPARA
jgi:hypothetical protein